MKYKLLTGYHGRFEDGKRVRYAPGDVLDLTREERAKLGDRVVPHVAFEEDVAGAGTSFADDSEESASGGAGDWSELLALSAAEAIELIGTLDDGEKVLALLDTEEAGRARKTVIAAATERLDALTVEK